MKQFNKNNKSLVKTDLLSSIISRRKKDTIVQLIDGEIYNTKKQNSLQLLLSMLMLVSINSCSEKLMVIGLSFGKKLTL